MMILLLLMSALTTTAFSVSEADRHVILISVDGLAAYHLENEDLELPNFRELIRDGAWPVASQSIFPSVTHPSHASLITGVTPRKHGVIGNRMTNRETGETFHPTTKSRSDVVHVKTLFDAAREAGLTTAAICWPETRGDAAIDFNILHGHSELDPDEVDPELLEFLRSSGIPIDTWYTWAKYGRIMQGYRDVILAESAAEIFKVHKPDLMAVHFLVTDSKQHGWGPKHYMAQAALTRADHNVGILRQAVRDAGLEDRTTFVIVTDHGFSSVYHEVNIYPEWKAAGLDGIAQLHGDRWNVFVETTDAFDRERDEKKLQTFFDNVLRLEGVRRIIKNEAFHDIGYPRYEENPHVPGQYIIIPYIDTYLTVDTETVSTRRRERSAPSHGHGYLPDHPQMYAGMIWSGREITRGIRTGMVYNIDVAPTIAKLLGLELPDAEGRVLLEILDK